MTQTTPARALRGAAAVLAAGSVTGTATVGSWRLAGLLGEGQFTQVFAAAPAHRGQGQPAAYAMKLLRHRRQEDSIALACLRREALIGRRVTHAHLVSVLSARLDAPPYYLIMPRLLGTTVRRWLSRKAPASRRLCVSACLSVVRQAAEALAALHADGWIHCDIKPDNLFLSPEGHVTLLDLGFARRPQETSPRTAGPLVGSAAYLAPEAFVSALAPDIRSDMYSLGVTLFELLAGQPPFPGSDPATLARHHLSTPPPDLRRVAQQLPGEVARLVDELLAKEPLRRPATPEALVERLVALEIMTFADRKPV
jgi:serine/threonine protein kinase